MSLKNLIFMESTLGIPGKKNLPLCEFFLWDFTYDFDVFESREPKFFDIHSFCEVHVPFLGGLSTSAVGQIWAN